MRIEIIGGYQGNSENGLRGMDFRNGKLERMVIIGKVS